MNYRNIGLYALYSFGLCLLGQMRENVGYRQGFADAKKLANEQ